MEASFIVSANALGILIIGAVAVTAIAPLYLLILWLKERRGGQLW